jgi:hypothetical protein
LGAARLLHWLAAIVIFFTSIAGLTMLRVAHGPTQDRLFDGRRRLGRHRFSSPGAAFCVHFRRRTDFAAASGIYRRRVRGGFKRVSGCASSVTRLEGVRFASGRR